MNALFDAIIRGSIRNRSVVLLAALALVVAGIWHAREAHLDALPSFTPPIVTVQAEAPGFGSSAVERQVTTPLEQQLLGIPGATQVRSTSSAGLSVIQLTFEDGTNIFRARQMVSERLAAAQSRLPGVLPAPQLGPIASPVGALLKFTYTVEDGSQETLLALSRFVQWQVAPRIQALNGVAHVTVHGAAAPRVEIRPDPAAMLAQGVSRSDIRHAIETAQSASALGHLRVGTQRAALRMDALWSWDRFAQVADTVVTVRGGTPIRVGDLAHVTRGDAPAIGTALQDGKRAVYVQVDKLPWADTLRVTEQAETVLAQLDKAAPPGSQRQPPVFRQTDFVRTSLWSVGRAMLLGSVLVIVVLLAFLRSPRVAAISLTALPLSILAAVVVLLLCGVTIDSMVLGGLAIAVGEVVDDAIVDVENIWRRLRENTRLPAPSPILAVIHDASVEVRGAVVYASLIIIVVLVPVLAVGGIAGRIFSPLAEAYALAVLSSLAVALTVTPALSALLLGRGQMADARDSALTRAAQRAYDRILSAVERRPGRVVAASVALGALALGALPFLGGGFLPEFREGVLIAELSAWPGTSIDETTRLAERVTEQLRAQDGLPHVAARVGRASLDEDAAPVHRIEMDLVLPRDSGEPEEVAGAIMQRMANVPGIRFSVDGFLGERINELLSGERAPIAVKLYGEDLHSLRESASRLSRKIARLPGVQSIRSRNLVNVPTTDLQLDAAALDLAGLRRAQVADAVASSQQGLPIAEMVGPFGFRIPVVLASPPYSAALNQLDDIPIWSAAGTALPLSSLVRLVDGTEPATIDHEQGRRVVTVATSVSPDALSRVGHQVEQLVAAEMFPAGLSWALAGQAVERRQASSRLLAISLLALAAVFAFLWMAFHSFTDATVVVAGLPLGLLGGVLAALFLPDGLSMAGLIGFVTLAGIISRNGIMLVAHKNYLIGASPEKDPRELILQAVQERLRPILMTAATAFLGLLPLAASIETAGSELEAPMAIIVCAGILSATALNLVAVPSFYLWRAHRKALEEHRG